MLTVLSMLRTIIGTGVGFVIWYLSTAMLAGNGDLMAVLLPVWFAGLVGGVVCTLFNPRQAITLSFTCGVLLAVGFLWFRHAYLGLDMGSNTFITLWPVWFPPAFYVGAHGYLLVLLARK